MWKHWSLFALGFLVIFLPLFAFPVGAKRFLGLLVGALIVIISFLIIRESYFPVSSNRTITFKNQNTLAQEPSDVSPDA